MRKRGVTKPDRRLGSRSTCRKGIRSWKQREFQNDQESSWQIGGPFSPAAAQDLHGSSRSLWPLASWWQCQSTQTSVFRLFLDFGKFGGIDWMHRPAACWSAPRAMLAAATASPRQCRCSRLSSGRAFIGLPSLSGAYWLRLQWCQYSVDKEPRTQPVFRCRGRACLCLGIRGMFALFMDGSTMQCARSTSVFVAQLERQAASHTRSHVSGHSVCLAASGPLASDARWGMPDFAAVLARAPMCASPRGRHGRQAAGIGERGERGRLLKAFENLLSR